MIEMKSHIWGMISATILGVATTALGSCASGAPTQSGQTAQPVPTPSAASGVPKPTLFIAGDSTAANGTDAARGWGKVFDSFFNPDKITVENRARGGRSSKTFILEGLWDQLISEVKRGDYVLIQFGHNDGGEVFTGKARASLPGLGDEYQDGQLADGSKQRARTFGYYMSKMVNDVRAKGATPIVLSLTIRNIWKNGDIEEGNGMYSEWSRLVAAERGAAFVDLGALIRLKYRAMGQEKVAALFPKDYVHTGIEGAEINAGLVVAGLRALAGDPFEKYLSEKGSAAGIAESKYIVEAPSSALRPLPEPNDPDIPSLFLIGDSTVRNGWGDGAGDQWGWGEALADYIDTSKINVVNRAVGGLSSRTYLTMGYWDATLALLKNGDVVLMQFGHNDGGAINDEKRARASIKGTGEETEEIDNLLTKKHEVVHTYGWYLRRFIQDAKAKGVTPIVCSLVPRAGMTDGKAGRSASYAVWAKEVAEQEGIGFVDLNNLVADRYDALGADKVPSLFPPNEKTHTNRAGADLNARCVVLGLKALANDPLAGYFSDKAAKEGL